MAILSILLDLLVLGFLGVTIYYAIKLTKSLNAFRLARQEFNQVMQELTRNITEAQRGTDFLKKTAQEAGAKLQKIINESRMITSELEVLNQDAPRARRAAPSAIDSEEAFQRLQQELLVEVEREDEDNFSIFDKEYQDDEPVADEPAPNTFKSAAEQDLYNALNKNRRGAA